MGDVKNTTKISIEAADAQLEIFIDYYGIDRADIETDQGPQAVKTIQNRLVRAIQDGYLEITQADGILKVVQKLKFPPGDIKQIEYSELSSKHKLAMDGISEGKSTARMHALMGSVSGLGAQAFSTLKGADMGIMEKLAVLFMVV